MWDFREHPDEFLQKEPNVEEDNRKVPHKQTKHRLLVYLVDFAESQIIPKTIVG